MAKSCEFKLVAGHAALDFANTLDNRYDPPNAMDLLASYEDLLGFCEQSAVITRAQAEALARRGERDKQDALQTARALREAIEGLFSSKARDKTPAAEDLGLLNHQVKNVLAHRQLIASAGSFHWSWEGIDRDAQAPVQLIAFAAAELLASDTVAFVRECQSETCRWLFLDLSKNHTRRWCDMKLCGNRVKARRHYQRQSDRV